jgi:hypothetical protein
MNDDSRLPNCRSDLFGKSGGSSNPKIEPNKQKIDCLNLEIKLHIDFFWQGKESILILWKINDFYYCRDINWSIYMWKKLT